MHLLPIARARDKPSPWQAVAVLAAVCRSGRAPVRWSENQTGRVVLRSGARRPRPHRARPLAAATKSRARPDIECPRDFLPVLLQLLTHVAIVCGRRRWRPPIVGLPHPNPCGCSARPNWASVLSVCLCLIFSVGVSRPVALLCASVCFSALLVVAVTLLPLLVRLYVVAAYWLLLSGLPPVAAAAPVLWGLLLFLYVRPCLRWPRPISVPLLLWLFSFSRRILRALPLAVAPYILRARVGPSASLQGGRQTLPVVLSMFSVVLSRWRRRKGRAIWANPQTIPRHECRAPAVWERGQTHALGVAGVRPCALAVAAAPPSCSAEKTGTGTRPAAPYARAREECRERPFSRPHENAPTRAIR